ncbi:hypothetical protein [Hymenobacter elongatus]|uniref:hypothetical protein n=1 Tax=Hymenobacter elongatus TaxID=877208 RepID=UPI001436BEA6|nr:hypothetical protein [Hymenobacter elongatus]
MQRTSPSSRFSRDEFCALIDTRLQELESSQDARRKYAAVLVALRSSFDAYQQTRRQKG